jgi:predicted alpha/beta hydrolase
MPWRPAVYLFYALLMPQLTRWLGFFPAKQFRAGEDLPARIAMQWGSRTKPHFDARVLGQNGDRITTLLANLKRATGHALILSATDDRWAGESSIRRYVFAASSLQPIRRSVSPAQVDSQSIGHWGYFRRRLGRTVWPIVHGFLAA